MSQMQTQEPFKTTFATVDHKNDTMLQEKPFQNKLQIGIAGLFCSKLCCNLNATSKQSGRQLKTFSLRYV